MKISVRAMLILLAVIAIIIIAGVVIMRIIFPSVLSKETTVKDFVKNQDNIITVTNYLINSTYDYIYINSNGESGVMFANTYGDVSISDSQVINAIDTLFKKGYSVIAKDGNTIHFQRSTRFRDFGSGIAYSIDGSEPQLQFLTKTEALTEPNWYYYEEDFNNYKRNSNSK